MATGGQKEVGCNLVSDGTLTLQTAKLDIRGIVVSGEMLMVADYKSYKVHLYRRRDAKLLATTDELESRPVGICRINDTEICVALDNGTILILSVQYAEDRGVIKRSRKLNVITAFDEFHGVVRFMDTVVVSGAKQEMIYWCIVSLNDGLVVRVHKMYKGDSSFLTTKDNFIYISCYAGILSPQLTGVYGYDIQNQSKQTFVYKHKDLDCPTGITVDTHGFLFVCNWSFITTYIHHLTDKCELVTIYREGIPLNPRHIFCDHGLLYVTDYRSNVITRFKLEYSHEQDPVISGEAKTKIDKEDGKGKQKMDSFEEIYSMVSHLALPEEFQLSVQRRALPPGKKFHAFFSYSSFDIQWVKKTVETLEKDHGFVCCEYDRDNTPGTPLMKFADDSIRYAYKTVVVMTREALQSGFVIHEIFMAINLGFTENRNCVVPVLLEDCEVPRYLRAMNYVDARDTKRKDVWWPKLLVELEAQGLPMNR